MPGDGSIFRLSNGQWRAQVSIGPRTARRYVTRTRPTRTAARAALDELRADQRAGVSPSGISLGAYLERWVDDVRNIRPATRHGYRAAVMYHLAPTIGHLRLADLTPADVERALTALAPAMSAKHLRNVHAVLRRALTHAVRDGHLARNVAGREYVDAPRVRSEEPDALSAAEVVRLKAAIAGDRLEALFLLALGTGLRQGELLGLAWQDIELGGADADLLRAGERRGAVDGGGISSRLDALRRDARDQRGGSDEARPAGHHVYAAIRVRYELARVDGAYRRVEPKTDRSRRTLPLAPALAAALAAHRQAVIDAGFVPTATGPVFTSRAGGPLNGSWLTHRFYALCSAAGIRRVPFKILRATFGSQLFAAGVSDLEIAMLLGHTRTHTTKRHYIALGSEHGDAVAAIERMVG